MLVSVNELRRYMGGFVVPEGLEPEVEATLMGVQEDLETYLNRPVELVQVRETVFSNELSQAYFSITPVRKIISVSSDITTAVAEPIVTPYVMTPDPLIGVDGRVIDKGYSRWIRDFRPWGMMTSAPCSRYVVEYVGGLYGQDIAQIKLAIKRVAAREISQNHVFNGGLRTGDIDRTEVGDVREIGFTPAEKRALQRFRRRVVR